MKVAIFDLDNCLSPADQVGEHVFAPVFSAIRQTSREQLSEARIKQILADCWVLSFDQVAKRYQFSPETIAAGYEAYAQLRVEEPFVGYPDIYVVPRLPVRRYLVTTGFRRFQDSKIKALGIESWFDGIVIDALDEPPPLGKQAIFQKILAQEGCKADQVLVIGDNPAAELAAGLALGMRTVQTVRPGVRRSDNTAHHCVEWLEELFGLLHG